MGTRPFFVDIDLNQNQLEFAVLHSLASPPSGGGEVEGQIYYDTGSQTPFFWNGSAWTSMSSAAASSVAFSGITSATNITATMTVGTGSIFTFSGGGIVNANQLLGFDIDAEAPTDGQILVYQGGSIDAWQALDSSSLGADLSSAVILAPTTTVRNTITPTSGATGLTIVSGATGGGNQVILATQTDAAADLFYVDNDFGDYRAFFTSGFDFVSVDTALQVRNGNALQVFNAGDIFSTSIAASSSLGGSFTLVLPASVGSQGQFLKNLGSSATSWEYVTVEDLADVDLADLDDGDILQWFGGSIDAWLAVPSTSISASLDEAVILSPSDSLRNIITSTVAGAIPLSVRAHASQSVDLFVVESPIGSDYFAIDNAGHVDIALGDLTVAAGDVTVGGTIQGGGSAGTSSSAAYILDNDSLGGGPRTFTFPNASGRLINTGETSVSAGEVAVATATLARVEFRLLTESDISDLGAYITDLSGFDTGDLAEGSNLYYTDERVDDRVATLIQDGTGIAWTYDDGANTLTANVSVSSFDLNDLNDVVITGTPADNEVLAYDTSSGDWINQTASEAGLADASHVHDASDITSGTLPIARGGTGGATQQAALDNLSGFTTRGDLLVQDASGNAVRLPIGTVGQFLVTDGTDPSWATITTTSIGEGSNLYYTDERVDDRVATLIQDGTGISWTYDDGANTLTANVSIASYDLDDLSDVVITGTPADNEVLAYDSGGNWINQTASEAGLAEASHTHVSTEVTDFDEAVDDRVSSLIIDGIGITWTYTDGSNTFAGDVSLSGFDTGDLAEGSNLYYTNERVDDRVAALIQDGTGISWTYDDGANTLTANVSVASYDLNDLSDVVITGTPADNEVLAYDTSSGDWINQTASEAGLTAGSGTSGQVAYWDGTSSLAGDTDFLFDGTNVNIDNGGELRITDIAASVVLGKDRAGFGNSLISIINDGNSPKYITLEHFYSGAQTGNELRFYRSRGSEASKTAISSGDEIGGISFYGYVSSGSAVEGCYILAEANENWGPSNAGAEFQFYTTTVASPSSASKRLTISSVGITSTVQNLAANGIEGAPAYSFSLDDDTGMYRSADNEVSITAGGSDVVTFTGGTLAATFAGDITAAGDVSIAGDLLVSGSATTINTTNLIVEDNFIIVNSMGVVQDAGIEVERGNTGSGDNAYLRFSEIVNEWFVDNGSTSHLVARKHAEEITGDDASTSFNIDHNMGTLYVVVQVFDSTTGKQIEVDVDVINTTRVTLEFNAAPTSGDSYRIIVVG